MWESPWPTIPAGACRARHCVDSRSQLSWKHLAMIGALEMGALGCYLLVLGWGTGGQEPHAAQAPTNLLSTFGF